MQEVKFKRGDRIRVTGTVAYVNSAYGLIGFLPDDADFPTAIRVGDGEGEGIELLDPEYWPPQPGDVWECNGAEWFVQCDDGMAREFVLISEYRAHGGIYSQESLNSFKASSPKLVRRRDQG